MVDFTVLLSGITVHVESSQSKNNLHYVSSAFASCIVDYINAVGGTKDTFIIYSNGCTYQNRNVYLSNALLRLSMEDNIAIYPNIFEKKSHTNEV